MSRVDLDAIQARADAAWAAIESADQMIESEWGDRDPDLEAAREFVHKDVLALVAEVRAAREICEALERWEALPGMFWGDTPETGSEVGAALTNWQKATGEQP